MLSGGRKRMTLPHVPYPRRSGPAGSPVFRAAATRSPDRAAIALPGIVTGLALNNGFRVVLGLPLGTVSVVAAYATFCIVVVYNNAAARIRSTGTRPEEASHDLGAGVFTTFRRITLPRLRSALVAGALLAFALSFDEIIVTTFTVGPGTTTLPIWILQNMFRPTQAPIVAVIAVVVIAAASVPLIIAQRLTRNDDVGE